MKIIQAKLGRKNTWWIILLVVSKDKCNNSIEKENSTGDLVNNQQGISYTAEPNEKACPSVRWYKTWILKVCKINQYKVPRHSNNEKWKKKKKRITKKKKGEKAVISQLLAYYIYHIIT